MKRVSWGVSLLCAVLTLTIAHAAPTVQWGFEEPSGAWFASPLDPGTQKVSLSTDRASQGHSSLALTGTLPGSFGVASSPWDDWTGARQLSFDLWVPAGVPAEFDVWVYLKDKQYLWYQTAPFRSPTTGKATGAFKPGQWLTVRLDVSPKSTIWRPGGHRKAWERSLFYPREFGIRVFSHAKWSGTLYLDNFQLTGDSPPLGPIPSGTPKLLPEKLKVIASAAQVPAGRKFELSFNLAREYSNPFDPKIVDVQGRFTGPDGQTLVIPGFLYQAYERKQTAQGFEELIPMGHTCWKVRFAPKLQGKYRYQVIVRDALGETRSAEQTFIATAAADPRGYITISKRDPRFFEFENGELFRPTGLNMRDGGDQASAQKGTYDFDYYFRRFSEEKLNFVRTWMCAWWAGIEWSEKYHSRFDGVGRYSLYNAWRLDYAFDLAEKYGLFLELTLNSHGQFRRDKFDAEWMYNPYSVRNAGFIASPAMFFSSPRAKELVKQRLRYIVARWGYSQHLMSWDLVNEVDLIEGHRRDEIATWHQEMASYIKTIDPWQHLVCTHICIYGAYGDELWRLPEIQYVQADAYWKRRDIGMNECWALKQQYNKPFLFIEYGPQTVSLPISSAKWQQDFRVGMWASNLIPSAAPGQFWYHQAWEENKLWRYQKGLLAFNAGDDRRGMKYVTLHATARAERNVELTVQALGNGSRGAFYLFQYGNMAYPTPAEVPAADVLASAEVTLPDFTDGAYRVDFWDAFAGKIISTAKFTATGGKLVITTPPFAQELAAKISPAG